MGLDSELKTGDRYDVDGEPGLALFRYHGDLCVVLLRRTDSGWPVIVHLRNEGPEFRHNDTWNTMDEVRKARRELKL